MGIHRFEEIQAQTGISSHLLCSRLKRMVLDGIVEKRLYLERPERYEYDGTEKGKELDAVLLALRNWGLRWAPRGDTHDSAVQLVYRPTTDVIDAEWTMPVPGHAFRFDDVDATSPPAYEHERAARIAAFRRSKRKRKPKGD
jgi:DNA-binding HxlR family transcriptional regulator